MEEGVSKLREVGLLEYIYYIRLDKLPADEVLKEGSEGPFIKEMRNALVRGTRIVENVGDGCLCRLGLTIAGAIAKLILLVSMGAVSFRITEASGSM